MKRSAKTTRPGFSLIEMLVVISIIAIVLAVSFPMIGAMTRDSNTSTGVNAISVAIPSARRYATKNTVFSNDLDPATPITEQGLYSGAAAIFTPANEIRLVKNTEQAFSSELFSTFGYRYLESYSQAYAAQGAGLPKRELNGFQDVGIDYLILPEDTGVAGINRVSGEKPYGLSASYNMPPLLLPPPFAVWYNQSGYLVASGWDKATGVQNIYQYVYYDGNYDGDFDALETRPRSFRHQASGLGPPYDDYNPNSGDFDLTNWNDKDNKYMLPFEALEAVVGVFVYSRAEFEDANARWADGDTDPESAAPPWSETSFMDENNNLARWEWMKLHGEMMMFSKQTGSLMRNRDE